MLRFGILSTAKIGREHVIPALLKANNCVVNGLASRDIKRARKLTSEFAIPLAFDSYAGLLKSDEIDAVYIPLPTSQHIEWAVKAADAGKHVLVEKPVALQASEINKLLKARERNGVIISEAFMITYHPQWLKVKELLAKGAIGTLRHVQAAFTYYNVDPNNMRNRPELGGGVIPDIAVYPTVATRFATGQEPKRVMATVDFDPVFATDRYASVRMAFENFELSFYLSTQLASRQSIVFHGDRGFIELSAPFNSNLYTGDEVTLNNSAHSESKVYRYTGIDQYQCQVEAFARAVSGKKQPVFSLEDSILNQRALDAIYKAAKTGRWESC